MLRMDDIEAHLLRFDEIDLGQQFPAAALLADYAWKRARGRALTPYRESWPLSSAAVALPVAFCLPSKVCCIADNSYCDNCQQVAVII